MEAFLDINESIGVTRSVEFDLFKIHSTFFKFQIEIGTLTYVELDFIYVRTSTCISGINSG